jgi:tRNA-specific 2-thiouridylase
MRALSLFSGGLDSLLAIKLMTLQDIKVTALFFDTGFGGVGDKKEYLQQAVSQAGGELEIIDIKEQFVKDILFDPQYGYGKNFNPCIDCHANMVSVAKALMPKYDASFIISGEVLGQRPMSQRSDAMRQVEKLSDIDGLLLRPLCAKLMPITKAEENGWVDREKLLDINGRGRDRQIKLAKEFGIEGYESPAGGCLLTDPNFSKKMEDFIKYDKFTLADIDVLKYGRHFRLPNNAKLVVSRNKDENANLRAIENDKFSLITLNGITGPISIISKNATEEEKSLAVKIILTYSKTEKDKEYFINIDDKNYYQVPFESKNDVKEYMLKFN